MPHENNLKAYRNAFYNEYGKMLSPEVLNKKLEEVYEEFGGFSPYEACLDTLATRENLKEAYYIELSKMSVEPKEHTEKPEKPEPIENPKTNQKPENQSEKMENKTEQTPNSNNVIDWRSLPKTEEEHKERKQRILIEGNAVVEKAELIFDDKIETTDKGAKFQRCPLIISFKSEAGEDVVEYYGGCRRWVNDDGTNSMPQFQKGGNSAVAKIFNRFCKKINVAEENAQLFHLMQFLNEQPDCIVMTEDVLNPATGKTVPKNAIMKFI